MTFKELYKKCKNKAKKEDWHFKKFRNAFEIMDVCVYENGEVALDDGSQSYCVTAKATTKEQFEFIKARIGLCGFNFDEE